MTSGFVVTLTRGLFGVVTGFIVHRAVRQQKGEAWPALLALVLISIGLFARELSVLGLRGIWFPLGTGVSRMQFAYAAFDVVLLALLLRCLLSLATEYFLKSGQWAERRMAQ